MSLAASFMSSASVQVESTALLGSSDLGITTRWRPDTKTQEEQFDKSNQKNHTQSAAMHNRVQSNLCESMLAEVFRERK